MIRHIYPALLWALLILALTLSPAPELPKVTWLNIPHADKIVHAILFGVFYFLLMLGFMKQETHDAYGRMVMWSVVIAVSYGALTEVLQLLLPTGRDGNLMDWLADCAGTGMAFIVYGWLKRPKSVSA